MRTRVSPAVLAVMGPGSAPSARHHRLRALRIVGASVGVVALFLLSTDGFAMPAAAPPAPTTISKQGQFTAAIHHIVFLMQENHAFDNFFGNYCQSISKYCSYTATGLPPKTCVPKNPANLSQGCVVPYNFTRSQFVIPDMPHDWYSTHGAWDKGKMDGFYAAEGSRNEAFGLYNGTTIPVYWDLAEQYGLADNFFSPAASYSLPNHWFDVAGAAPNISYLVKTQVNGTPVSQLHQYLNQSNATPTLTDELNHSRVTWNYYDFPLNNYTWSTQPIPQSPAYGYWNPLAAREQSYKFKQRPHFVPRNNFYADAANGSLPNISWIIPTPAESDHPSTNLSTGESWVASIVDAIEASPEWNSTALFLSWDEYGGFYDQVAPPTLDAYGDGFRVPLIAVSPWVVQGFIDHVQMDFSSVVHLMETTFHLKCLTSRDCNAALPLLFFNFNKAPRAPIYIPPYGNATYPMPLQSSGKLPPYLPSNPPMAPAVGTTSATSSAGTDWS